MSVIQRRRTKTTLKVLTVLNEDHEAEHYGLGLMRATGLRSGIMYPILSRLEDDGWLQARWEERDEPGPRRRLYRLTKLGKDRVATLVNEQP